MPFPGSQCKPRPKLLEKRDKQAAIDAKDRAENAKVKQRGKGQCEVQLMEAHHIYGVARTLGLYQRCPFSACHMHHLISGIGRRNIGRSILAAHKLHVCATCHADIHGHVLVPVDGTQREEAATVRYERVR